jgi:aspartokinase
VAVVVSAMAGETDRLVNFCREASALYDPAEYDVVVASGEQVTSGLLAMHLQALGCKARSWLGWQLPVRTDDAFSKARIEGIDSAELLASMAAGEVAVIPGFQGRDRQQPHHHAGPWRVGHLGRGRGRRDRRRPLRHLHRRRRGLYHRPAHRGQGAQAQGRDL